MHNEDVIRHHHINAVIKQTLSAGSRSFFLWFDRPSYAISWTTLIVEQLLDTLCTGTHFLHSSSKSCSAIPHSRWIKWNEYLYLNGASNSDTFIISNRFDCLTGSERQWGVPEANEKGSTNVISKMCTTFCTSSKDLIEFKKQLFPLNKQN